MKTRERRASLMMTCPLSRARRRRRRRRRLARRRRLRERTYLNRKPINLVTTEPGCRTLDQHGRGAKRRRQGLRAASHAQLGDTIGPELVNNLIFTTMGFRKMATCSLAFAASKRERDKTDWPCRAESLVADPSCSEILRAMALMSHVLPIQLLSLAREVGTDY
ncbi:hypothetical protein B0H63DRAFT_149791 [Podospora didyma]|uniref:Uncharacterized protein n=1 Tax=Podospora didyma TaxID=330526 RepID=A0AAE0U1G9_9PEZI|nr:hypothetical protein B0H63DRAFT_149791 [Podospora didyma]